jgi:hypothetical protein
MKHTFKKFTLKIHVFTYDSEDDMRFLRYSSCKAENMGKIITRAAVIQNIQIGF